MTTEEDEREAHATAIAQLLGSAETTTEMNALTRVGLRAGFLWRCPTCKEPKYANRETCCDKPRPA
ncbi:hypothetical protein GCM10022384_07670 [Streptomyces marokkonensis]|uniref:Uncharacterized protein n=1 Tax=Streptomyces marokkonensis TaxID=324855 RepID=A0ABP7NZ67_9ACTN